jgi:hypothetical protein
MGKLCKTERPSQLRSLNKKTEPSGFEEKSSMTEPQWVRGEVILLFSPNPVDLRTMEPSGLGFLIDFAFITP